MKQSFTSEQRKKRDEHLSSNTFLFTISRKFIFIYAPNIQTLNFVHSQKIYDVEMMSCVYWDVLCGDMFSRYSSKLCLKLAIRNFGLVSLSTKHISYSVKIYIILDASRNNKISNCFTL